MSLIINVKGFNNLGNTCYMNSALQALLSSDIMNTALMFFLKNNPESVNSMNPILLEYCRIIIELLDDKNDVHNRETNILVPRNFKQILDRENQLFRGFSQHDSNELLVYMINEFTETKKNNKDIAEIVKKLCFGKYKQYVYCKECKNVSINYANFLDVLLPIPSVRNNKYPDLEDCFKKFAIYEELTGDNKWICPTCKKKVDACKKMEIETVPEIAIFTLNRFKGMAKNDTPVLIYEYIELEDKKLKLISTVNHYGNVGGGHYVAHISRNDNWFVADDSRIRPIDVKSLMCDPSVYMVVYQEDE